MSTIDFDSKPLVSNRFGICAKVTYLLHFYIWDQSMMMGKIDFTQQFALRLRNTMIEAGFNSQRSTSGVNIHKLTEITGHSPQICRKYLRGQAIPDPLKLIDIALQLDVSPGWLLFGDHEERDQDSNHKLTINTDLLHYIFTQAETLYHSDCASEERSDFLLELTSDLSQINANEEQSKKIIDLALASARHFSGH